MKNFKSIIFITATIGTLSACENDKFYYQDEARVRIEGPYEWAMDADSLNFSFASSPSTVVEKNMEMTMYVMGNASESNRTAILKVNQEKTTAEASQYELPEQIVIPAGKLETTFNIVLKRASALTEKTVCLFVEVAQSADFNVGVAEQNHFQLKWNDILSKPQNWDTELTDFFGTYSLTKYRFIIDVTGVAEFGGDMTWSEMMNYKIIVKSALTEYNEAHPDNPLTDEYGQLVTF